MVILASLVWGAPGWLWPAVVIAVVIMGLLAWGYSRAPTSPGVRVCAGLLKALGVAALLFCLLEPLLSGRRPQPGANLFVVLADDSQSLKIRDPGAEKSRIEVLQEVFDEDTPWLSRLCQDFDVRRYRFAERLQSLDRAGDLTAEGNGSSLATALGTISQRFDNRPLAGVILLSDGNATDLPDEAIDWSELPAPVYPVPIGKDAPSRDVSIRQVAVSQTNFEQTPVTIRAEIDADGYDDEDVVVALLDQSGTQLQRQALDPTEDGSPRVVRFRLRPEEPGVSFYTLWATARSDLEQPEEADEATLANNRRLVVVDRPRGPYRVLYVSGRPNWEYKYLRRAVAADDEVELVALIRIAKREPKFAFLDRYYDRTNPLYTGFEDQEEEEMEQYDQPVLIRLDTVDDAELRDGFPQTADTLYRYDAVILDDVEAEFFTAEHMLLLQKFVSQRGGGLLMLGGTESFREGQYERTPIGDMLPVYLDRLVPLAATTKYRFALTREGLLEPWVRVREIEEEEWRRLEMMPSFETFNRAPSIKPGATVLANAVDAAGKVYPALVTHRFGRGRAAALLVGDLWRWGLRREVGEEDNMSRTWRQTVRWLVADVPRRIEIDARRKRGAGGASIELDVRVRDPDFRPMDNASVELVVTTPDGEEHRPAADARDDEAGAYVATYVPRQSGAYRAQVQVTAADGSQVGEAEAGWTAEPAADEFQRLAPDLALLKRIADETGGEVIAAEDLHEFVSDLPNRKVPITEPWDYPLWHQPLVFLLAIGCLAAEWGLRRTKGLP